MSAYSVAEAKNRLPELIDRALKGEDVVITRHGHSVVELKPVPASAPHLDGRGFGLACGPQSRPRKIQRGRGRLRIADAR